MAKRRWWCYPIPSERWGRGGTPRRPKFGSCSAPRSVWTRGQKWKKYCQRWRAREAQMHQRLTASTWWCGPCLSYKSWVEMARQLSQGVRQSGQSPPIVWNFTKRRSVCRLFIMHNE